MDGVLNINKPRGMTSHDVVQTVRRLLRQKRIGHTGTLDPLATGVLVLCIGRATRIARFLEAGEKEYQAILRLGITTDTLDAEGQVVETRHYTPPPESELRGVLGAFTGVIMQTPPLYSAVKVRGVPSYKLARAGKGEALKPRSVTIYQLDLVAYNDPFVSICVRCSKGVYIRSLCADIGARLGTGAHVTGLQRTRSGRFTVGEAVTLEQLAGRSEEGIRRILLPIDRAVDDMPAITLRADQAEKILHGATIAGDTRFEDVLVRVHDQSGRLIALTRAKGGEISPEIVFAGH